MSLFTSTYSTYSSLHDCRLMYWPSYMYCILLHAGQLWRHFEQHNILWQWKLWSFHLAGNNCCLSTSHSCTAGISHIPEFPNSQQIQRRRRSCTESPAPYIPCSSSILYCLFHSIRTPRKVLRACLDSSGFLCSTAISHINHLVCSKGKSLIYRRICAKCWIVK